VLRRKDVVTLAIAVGVHAGLAVAMTRGHEKPRQRSRPVELVFARPDPPAPVVAAASAERSAARALQPTPPRRRVALLPRRVAPAAPTSPAPPSPAPVAAPRPMFGVSMTSPTEVATGEPLAVGSPNGSGAAPSASTGSGSGPTSTSGASGSAYHPASESDVDVMPEIDVEACGRAASYPSDAEQAGIEGDVRLRVALNEQGGIHDVRVLSGPGHGLDRAAVEAIRHKCRFSPARVHGQAVAFVIESYRFHFELPR
jgi:protein TonB